MGTLTVGNKILIRSPIYEINILKNESSLGTVRRYAYMYLSTVCTWYMYHSTLGDAHFQCACTYLEDL